MILPPTPFVAAATSKKMRPRPRNKTRPHESVLVSLSKDEREAARSIIFEQCAKAYIDSHAAGWRNAKHAQQWTNTLATYVYPTFGSVAVVDVDVAMIMKALEPIWAAKPETAGRVRGRIEAVLDWAKARGFGDGENPARWRGHLSNLLPARTKVRDVKHHAALPYPEIGVFMADLRTREGAAAAALEFLILTAAGTGEVIGARRSEIDFLRAHVDSPGRAHEGQTRAPGSTVVSRRKR